MKVFGAYLALGLALLTLSLGIAGTLLPKETKVIRSPWRRLATHLHTQKVWHTFRR